MQRDIINGVLDNVYQFINVAYTILREHGMVDDETGCDFDSTRVFHGSKANIRSITDCPIFVPKWGKNKEVCCL